MLIKVCGLTAPNQVTEISKKVDFVGFIFYPKSKRFIGHSIPSHGAKKTGVFVNEPLRTILDIARYEKLDAVQLHGSERPEYCAALEGQVTVFKAFGIHDDFDFSILEDYVDHVDFFLFDTKTPQHGGSGKQFNWEKLNDYNLKTPFFLSGGISPDSVEAIKNINHSALAGLDLNSRFETQPGIKDINILNTFIDAVRNN